MPRGIVGSERGGVLTNQLKDNPYCVVLLDEVEKASPNTLNLFLQAFDEGWMTDGRGKRVYLSDAVDHHDVEHRRRALPQADEPARIPAAQRRRRSRSRARCMRELERRFPPEFRNRIDEVVLFAPLTHDEVREIARHYLQQVTLALAKAGKTIDGRRRGARARGGEGLQHGVRRALPEALHRRAHQAADQRAAGRTGRTST